MIELYAFGRKKKVLSLSSIHSFRTNSTLDSKGGRKWVKRANLVDSRDSVQDIKFGPRHTGLRIVLIPFQHVYSPSSNQYEKATCSSDGFVRIYEASDVTNLAHWSLQVTTPISILYAHLIQILITFMLLL
jgi:hypothetical protein